MVQTLFSLRRPLVLLSKRRASNPERLQRGHICLSDMGLESGTQGVLDSRSSRSESVPESFGHGSDTEASFTPRSGQGSEMAGNATPEPT